jgi:hypothetical protein
MRQRGAHRFERFELCRRALFARYATLSANAISSPSRTAPIGSHMAITSGV